MSVERIGYVELDPVFCVACLMPITLDHKYFVQKRALKVDKNNIAKYRWVCQHSDCDNPSRGTHNVTGTQFERNDGHRYRYIVPLIEQGKQASMEPIDPNERLKSNP